MPRLSVIIPTYNRSQLLPHAVNSVRQAGADLEVIVVDNASTDSTPQICAQLENIRYLRLDRNFGEGGARNKGVAASQAPYVAFLDDDDLRLPGSLEKQLEVLDKDQNAAIVYGPVMFGRHEDCRPTGESYPKTLPTGDVFWDLLDHNFIPMPSVVARKQRLIEAGLFESSLRPVRDWDLWLRVAERFPFTAVNEPVAIYRRWDVSGHQISANRAGIYRAAAAVQAEALQLPRARQAARATRRQVRSQFLNRTADALLYEAVTALLANQTVPACRNVLTALRLQPSRFLRREHLRGLLFSGLKAVSNNEGRSF